MVPIASMRGSRAPTLAKICATERRYCSTWRFPTLLRLAARTPDLIWCANSWRMWTGSRM
eukprot:2644251-Ditylum_brightwellii.AAC.1